MPHMLFVPRLALVIFVSLFLSVFELRSQDTLNAIIHFNDGKVIETKTQNKLHKRKLRTISHGTKHNVRLREIDHFYINDDKYIVDQIRWLSDYNCYKLRVDGSVQVLEYKGSTFIRLKDYKYIELVITKRPLGLVKHYLSDFPDEYNKETLIDHFDSTIVAYNNWKLGHPNSKSKQEANIHRIQRISARFGLLGPSLGLELSFSKYHSLVADAGMIAIGASPFGTYVNFRSIAELRYYFTQKRRESKLRITQQHTAEYVALGTSAYTSTVFPTYYLIHGVLGTQYAYRKWLIDSYLGGGVEPLGQQLYLVLGAKIGFRI